MKGDVLMIYIPVEMSVVLLTCKPQCYTQQMTVRYHLGTDTTKDKQTNKLL